MSVGEPKLLFSFFPTLLLLSLPPLITLLRFLELLEIGVVGEYRKEESKAEEEPTDSDTDPTIRVSIPLDDAVRAPAMKKILDLLQKNADIQSCLSGR